MTRRLVTTREAAELLGVSPATIWDWRRQGLVEPARRNRWDLRALRAAQRAPKPYRAERPTRKAGEDVTAGRPPQPDAVRSGLLEDLQRIADAHEQIRQAAAEIATAREQAHRRVLLLAWAHAEQGTSFPLDLARDLNWQQPDIRVETIGHAIGVANPSDVHSMVGPADCTWTFTCRRCRQPVEVELKVQSRADAARRSPRRPACDRCAQHEEEERRRAQAEWEAWQKRIREHTDRLRALVAAGSITPDTQTTYARFGDLEYILDEDGLPTRPVSGRM